MPKNPTGEGKRFRLWETSWGLGESEDLLSLVSLSIAPSEHLYKAVHRQAARLWMQVFRMIWIPPIGSFIDAVLATGKCHRAYNWRAAPVCMPTASDSATGTCITHPPYHDVLRSMYDSNIAGSSGSSPHTERAKPATDV